MVELDEDTVTRCLVLSKGDLVRASTAMNVRPSKLVQWIKSVPSVQLAWCEMVKMKAEPEFDTMSRAQFEAEVQSRLAVYRLEGLEVIHELATTDHAGVASMAEVRLKAAIALRGTGDMASSGDGGVLSELNALYQRNAPRIKSMRAVQIEFEEPTPVASPLLPD